MNVVAGGLAVYERGVAPGVLEAGARLVDEVLEDGGVDHCEGGDPETCDDAVDGWEADACSAEGGHEDAFHEGEEDDDGDGVEVLHQVVGDAVRGELGSLRDEVVAELAVDDPVDGVESEDFAGRQGALNLVDEVVVPLDLGGYGVVAKGRLVGRLRGVHVAALDHHPDGAEAVRDNGALGRAHNVDLAAEDEDHGTDEEHAEAEQESGPETDIALHVGGRDQRQGSQVDAEVEDHVDARDGDSRVDDDALARLLVGRDLHLAAFVLISDQRSDIGLDTTGTETNDDNGRDETSQAGTSRQSARDRSAGEDEKTDDVDEAEDQDGVVLSEVLISDDGTEDGRDCVG